MGIKRKYKIYDAFEDKGSAQSAARDLRAVGETATVKKISPQAGGRLKYGLYTAGAKKKKKK